MSMISGQCDELRRIADKDTVPYEASDAMYLAADTIWELRCKLAGVVDQREKITELEAENAELREERDIYRGLFNLTTQPDRYVQVMDENAKLRAERDYLLMNSNPTATELRRVRRAWKNDRDENAKLRELVRDMCDLLPHADWPSTECDDRASACIDQAIELGIGVKDD